MSMCLCLISSRQVFSLISVRERTLFSIHSLQNQLLFNHNTYLVHLVYFFVFFLTSDTGLVSYYLVHFCLKDTNLCTDIHVFIFFIQFCWFVQLMSYMCYCYCMCDNQNIKFIQLSLLLKVITNSNEILSVWRVRQQLPPHN